MWYPRFPLNGIKKYLTCRNKFSVWIRLVECCFTFTETVGLLWTGAQDGYLDFPTAPEFCSVLDTDTNVYNYGCLFTANKVVVVVVFVCLSVCLFVVFLFFLNINPYWCNSLIHVVSMSHCKISVT